MAGSFAALRRSRSTAQRNPRKSEDNGGSDSGISGAASSGPGNDDGNIVDPESAAPARDADGNPGSDGNDQPRRKRGRPPGSGNKAKASANPVISGGIEKTLLSIHKMGAAFFSAPEWELQENEAKSLAAAIAEVEKHYKIPGMSEEHAAILGLVLVAGSIYAPRIILTATKRKSKGRPQQQAQQEQPQMFTPSVPGADSFKPSFMN